MLISQNQNKIAFLYLFFQRLKWYNFLWTISVILNLDTLYSVMYAPFWVKFNLCFNYSNFIIKFRRKVAIFSISIKGKGTTIHFLYLENWHLLPFSSEWVELHYLNISSWINNGFSIQSLCLVVYILLGFLFELLYLYKTLKIDRMNLANCWYMILAQ